MQRLFKAIFGGVVAFILLTLYSSTAVYMICKVIQWGQAADPQRHEFDGGLVFVVTTIGGLVSALVVSNLAITRPGDNPAVVRMALNNEGKHKKAVTSLVVLYLAVWLLTGLAALVTGVMLYPNINQTLSDIGTTWLGLAVASGYAYFGIQPSS